MIAVALRVTALILAAGVLAWALRRRSASLRAALWTATLLAVLLMPLLPSPQVVVPVAAIQPPMRLAPLRPPLRIVSQPEVATTPEEPSAFAPDPVGWDINPASFAWGFYLLGAVFSAGGAALALIRAARLVRQSRPCAAVVLEVASRIARERGLTRPRIALAGETPLVAGPFRPTILLPDSARGWDEARLETVLRHEIAHVERRDGLALLLARLALVVYWCHPLVFLAARQLRQECERAADDAALAGRTKPSDYAEELLAWSRGAAAPAATLPMVRRSGLAARLRHILDAKADRRRASRRAKTGFALGALLLGAALPAARAEFARTVSVVTALPPRPVDSPEAPVPVPSGPPGPAFLITPDGSSIRILHLLTMGPDLILHAWDIHGHPVRVTDARERLYVKNQVKANPSASKRWVGACIETSEPDPDPRYAPFTQLNLSLPSSSLMSATLNSRSRGRSRSLEMFLMPEDVRASDASIRFAPGLYRTVWERAVGRGPNEPQALAKPPLGMNTIYEGRKYPLRWLLLPGKLEYTNGDWNAEAILSDGTRVWRDSGWTGGKGEVYVAFEANPRRRIVRVRLARRTEYDLRANNLPLVPVGG